MGSVMNKKEIEQLQQETLRKNPRVDTSVVAAYRRLEKKLAKLGVEVKPKYNLEPPLGQDRIRIYNRS